ncbi:hypothetical protein K9B35_14240 [Sphingomonas sp. R647]|uniref:hypothetical protein n=1 Tax=Sphingomonas sp. R647 TaxID=2875233 RepID=UPI001CD53370|nr:hypothetical protein [Sphingomonas sp. R647]MCA1199133.1 hypothetical protein [Sphingomonas sp. R647]
MIGAAKAVWAFLGWRGTGALIALAAVTILNFQLAGARLETARARVELADERTAHRITVANVRLAAAQAKIADAENAKRVIAEQSRINQEVSRDYQTRLAGVRARADALRLQLQRAAPTDPSSAADPRMPAAGTAAGGPDGAAAQDRLPLAIGLMDLEDRLIATEQAMQLEALQAWVRAQAAIENNGPAPPAR